MWGDSCSDCDYFSVVVAVADTPQKEGAGIFGAPLTKHVLKRIYPVIGQLSKPKRKYL